MPRIPLLNEQVRRTPEGARGDILAQEKLAIGGAIQQVTGEASKFFNNLQKSRDESDLSSALAFSASERTTGIGVIKEDGDVDTAGDKFKASEKAIRAEVKRQWPRVASEWEDRDRRHSETTAVKLTSWQSKKQIDLIKSVLVETERVWKDEAVSAVDDVSLGVATANYFESLDGAVKSGAINASDAAERKQKFAVSVTSARIDRDIDANPLATLKKIESGGYPIPEEKRLAKAKLARRTLAARRKDLNNEKKTNDKIKAAEEKKKNDVIASDLAIAVSRGEAGIEDIEKSFNAEIITPAKRTQLIKEYDSYHKKTRDLSSLVELVSTARNSGITLDARDKQAKDAVDQYYKVVSPTWEKEDIVPQTISLIKDVKVIPETVKSGIRTWARSGDDEQAVSMAILVDKIRSDAPETLQDLATTEKAFASQVNRNIANGMDIKKAVSFARENVFVKSTTPEQRNLVNKMLTGNIDKIDSFISGKMDDFFDPFFTIEPDVPIRMQADFNVLLDEYAMRHGDDLSAASESAWADTVQVWGRSTLNGSAEMVKYAPELIYFGSREEVPGLKGQLLSAVKPLGLGDGDFMLGSDQQTASEYIAGSRPTYPLFSGDGLSPILGPDNMPVRWSPEVVE